MTASAIPADRADGRIFGDIRPAAARKLEFDSVLRLKRESGDSRAEARAAAEEFVAQSLVLPILKSIREQNQASEPFAPGDYERTIGGLFDLEIATRIVRSRRFPIVDAVARNLLREPRTAPAAAGALEHGGSDDDSLRPKTGREAGIA